MRRCGRIVGSAPRVADATGRRDRKNMATRDFWPYGSARADALVLDTTCRGYDMTSAKIPASPDEVDHGRTDVARAARAATVVLIGLIMLQAALAAGAPLG